MWVEAKEMKDNDVYEFSDGATIEIWGKDYDCSGKLCTPEDPEGNICGVVGCGHLEALGVLTQIYCRRLKRQKERNHENNKVPSGT